MRILHTYDTCINFNEETENGAPRFEETPFIAFKKSFDFCLKTNEIEYKMTLMCVPTRRPLLYPSRVSSSSRMPSRSRFTKACTARKILLFRLHSCT